MAYPNFDGFDLQNDSYITSAITYRNSPERVLETQQITRRPGVRVLNSEFGSRKVSIEGSITGTDPDDLQSKIDALNLNVTRKVTGALYTRSNRYLNALLQSMSVGDAFYNQSYVPFTIDFLCYNPFFYDTQLSSVTWTVASGTVTLGDTVTISGSVFAVPTFTYMAHAGTGHTTTSGINLTYTTTGETLTWSGTGGLSAMSYSDVVTFDYDNELITQNAVNVEPWGFFSRWEPGQRSFTCTFSGTSQGGTLQMSYYARYL